MGLEEKRSGRYQTSYDIGLTYTPPPLFNTGLSKGPPLPPLPRRALVSHRTGPRSATTYGSEHSGKPQAWWQRQAHCPKPRPHWNTHYLDGLAQRLKRYPSIRQLSAPVSEARDSYRGLAAPAAPSLKQDDTLLKFYGHHDQMPLSREPPISTSHVHYRLFDRSELLSPSGLDVSSDDLNLFHSHTHIHPPLQKAPPLNYSSSVRMQHLPFAEATVRLSRKASEYQDRFNRPPRQPAASALACWGTGAGAASAGVVSGGEKYILAVPHMYETESKRYRSNKIMVV